MFPQSASLIILLTSSPSWNLLSLSKIIQICKHQVLFQDWMPTTPCNACFCGAEKHLLEHLQANGLTKPWQLHTLRVVQNDAPSYSITGCRFGSQKARAPCVCVCVLEPCSGTSFTVMEDEVAFWRKRTKEQHRTQTAYPCSLSLKVGWVWFVVGRCPSASSLTVSFLSGQDGKDG